MDRLASSVDYLLAMVVPFAGSVNIRLTLSPAMVPVFISEQELRSPVRLIPLDALDKQVFIGME